MKFDAILALAVALYLSPNAVAFKLPGLGDREAITATALPSGVVQPTGTFPGGPEGHPRPDGHPSGHPGPLPTGAAPSGFFDHDERREGARPTGGFGEHHGHGGEAKPSLANALIPSATPGPDPESEPFERVHARQIHPILV
ncbi:uncharacterized protein N7459_004328 [Penicillium hispanicum]|uniref:uncharacterized protein n=1 Tax=Penicillium hispanicum TaxID=1080232 RepID=UPI0025414471|nr:uncharacterized protein N7459_004328 [Penicillium hispanicum]KAJ5584528.1 hypothetical protein N7459_004328 [Penicillium hispanicum]